MHVIRLFFSFCFLIFAVSAAAETFVSVDVPVPIPDGPSGIAESFLPIPINREIVDVNITFSITHPWVGDLNIYLEAPSGDDVRLVYRCGGSQNGGDNFTNTTLDDEAAAYVCSAMPPYTDAYQPEHPLYALDGQSTWGTWTFRVTDNAWMDEGTITAWQLEIVLGDTLDAADAFIPNPSSLFLAVYPNPFNPVTTLSFSLPQQTFVRLVVYDVIGQEIAALANETYFAGEHRIRFDGSHLPAGIYFARLSAGTQDVTRKLMLVR